jgi:hypothetical protein
MTTQGVASNEQNADDAHDQHYGSCHSVFGNCTPVTRTGRVGAPSDEQVIIGRKEYVRRACTLLGSRALCDGSAAVRGRSVDMNRALLATLGFVTCLGFAACSGGSGLPTTPSTQGSDDGGSTIDVGGNGSASLSAAMTQDFGSLVVGQQGQPVQIKVTNTGTVSSGVLSTTLSGPQAVAFLVDNDGCKGQTLASMASCTVTMHFVPTSVGANSATLALADPMGDAVSVMLTGGGMAPVELSLLPATQDFGTVVDGAASSPTTFTLANTGMADTGVVQMKLGGADSEQFTLSMDGCSGKPLKAGTRCSALVAFAPSTSGNKMATLNATIAGGSTLTSALTGIGAGAAAFTVMPSGPYDFGPATIGANQNPVATFTLTNSGGVMSGVPNFTVTGANMGDFAVDGSGCTATLAAPGSCQFKVTFTPSVAMAETATVGIDAPATMPATLVLNGTGNTPPALQANPDHHNFGNVLQGATSSDETFTITNTGTAMSGALNVSIGGSNGSLFGIGNQTCAGTQLAGGASCTIAVHFAPDSSTSGDVQAPLVFSAMPGGTGTAMLTGTVATQANLAIGPGSFDFGVVAQGTQTSPTTFTVTNNGTQSSGSPTVTVGGSNPSDFVVVSDNCTGNPVAGNSGTCTVSVAFKPSTQAPESATITVAASPGGALTANLSGQGATQALLQVTPSPGGFGDQVQNTQSNTKTFTVTNNGGVTSGTVVVSMGGTNGGDFKIITNNCNNQTLPANGSKVCTVLVAFKPANLGMESATLSATAAPGGTTTSTLTGNGVTQGTLAVSPNPGAFSGVNKGQSKKITFQVSNGGGAPSGTPNVTVTAGTGPVADFKITANSCTAAIPANTMNGCSIDVTFTPTTTSGESATLTVAANPGGTTVPLSGTGTTPTLSIATVPAFTTLPGTTAVNPTVVIKNGGSGPTGNISLSGLPNSGFSVTSDPCTGTTIAAGGQCILGVTYAPPANEALGHMDTATLTVNDAYAASDTASAKLSGTALAQGISLTMTSTPTPATYNGSGSVTFTVTNRGATPSKALGAVTIHAGQTGTDDLDGDFTPPTGGANTCAGTSLMGAQSCSYTLVFTAPTSSGGGDASVEGGTEGGTTITGAPFTGTTSIADGTNSPPSDTFSGCTQAGACGH